MNASIITTGNELEKEEIMRFSQDLSLPALYSYLNDVRQETDELLCQLSYQDLRKHCEKQQREQLEALGVVHESAAWLIAYWCGKDVKGWIQMPFSRHWIMHIEACLRIKNKLHP